LIMSNTNKKSIGLDISDYTIEAAALEISGTETRISSLGSAKLPLGVVERGRIKDEAKLKLAITEALTAAKIDPGADSIIFGLPEALVYVHVFFFDPAKSQTLDDAIVQEIENTVPFRLSDLIYAHRALGSLPGNKTGTGILLAAAVKAEVLRWRNFFRNSGFSAPIFDIESLAVFRGIFDKYPSEPVCLVDIGATTTLVSIFSPLGLTYSYIINSAGQNISYQLANELGVSFAEAEEIKVKYGLGPNDKYPKAAGFIGGILAKIFREIKNNIDYFNSEFSFPRVKEVIVIGGSSKLSGLEAYIKTLDLGVDIRMGQPLYAADPAYTEAIGLAARGLSSRWDKSDPAISMAEVKNNTASPANAISFIKDLVLKIKSRLGVKEYKKIAIVGAVSVFAFACFYIFFSYLSVNKSRPPVTPLPVTSKPPQTEANPEPVVSAPLPAPAKIRIKKISSPLNVRQGAGTNFRVAGKAGPGEEFISLEEADGWIKIRLTDGVEGWVFAEYTERVE